MKTFSIIIPVYNVEKYLNNCLDSILKQDFNDYELILVNDGSTDNSKQICEKYQKKDERIRLINKKNEGSGIARNVGIENANGKYVFFPDSDDVLPENSLRIMYEEIQKNDADFYVFSYIESTRDNKYVIERKRQDITMRAEEVRNKYQKYIYESEWCLQGAPWNKLFKLEIIKRFNIKYPTLVRHQDEVFIARYIDKIETIKMSNKIIYKYFINTLKSELIKFPKNYFEIRTDLFKEFSNIMLKWNKKNIKLKDILNYTYICVVQKCLEYSYNKNWKMGFKQRKKYFEEILNNEIVIQAIFQIMSRKKEIQEIINDELKISKWKIKMTFNIMKLMQAKKITLLLIISKIRSIIIKIIK